MILNYYPLIRKPILGTLAEAVALVVLLSLASCINNSSYKGYTQTSSGLYYKLLTIGDGKSKPYPGCFLQLRMVYKTIKDSIFFDTYASNETRMVMLPFNHSSFKGSFEEGLTKMNEGDSASYIVSADSLFKNFFKADLPLFLEKGSAVKMDVKLNRILSKNEYQTEIGKFDKVMEDRDIEEPRMLKKYLDTTKTKFLPINNGMYYCSIKKGVGDCVKYGDLVKINYRGCFLDGKQFESTYERAQPLDFNFGDEGQVIQGFTTAISLMNEGAKAKFIIPSCLAYGESGSSTNVVPPYTTVIYEIELVSLTKHNN
jgi:FKBP-type peptidyl-prolyl cis-trans isomerase